MNPEQTETHFPSREYQDALQDLENLRQASQLAAAMGIGV